MRVVAGLGNPGRKYEQSRHNLGFRVLDRIAARLGQTDWKSQFQALTARGQGKGGPFLLVKPQTFMNLSGEALGEIVRFYKVPLADCLVVVDDMDLPLGKIRLRDAGSDGGHRGLRSIIEHLGGNEFKRIRVGIGRPPEGESVVGHVLSGSSGEARELEHAVELAAELALRYLESGTFENWSSP
jgi:PTH1 family peptidyl-tRNA hydrolase